MSKYHEPLRRPATSTNEQDSYKNNPCAHVAPRTLYQQPSSSSSADQSDTRGMMKRLLSKPAPPSSSSVRMHTNDPVQLPPQSPDDFDKSIRALDLVGQIDISIRREPDESNTKRPRNVLRRRPSGNKSTPISDKGPLTPPLQFPRRNKSFSPPSSTPKEPKSPDTPSPAPESAAIPYYTVFGDTSGNVVAAGGPRDPFWDTYGGEYGLMNQQNEEAGPATAPGGLTRVLSRTLSGRRKKQDSEQQIRSKTSIQELRRSSDGGIKKIPDSPTIHSSPGAGSPSRRFWKLMKKISVSGLREKSQADVDPPPVPPLPNNLLNNSLHPARSSDSSLVHRSGSKTVVSSSLVSPTATKPPLPSQYNSKLASHPSGPRPSTTTLSSSHSSDVASSRFFNRTQSARSSTSSFGEEIQQPPPLPKPLVSTINNDGRKLQQHIIPPSELSRNYSTSKSLNSSPLIPVPIPVQSSMDDDWTIVRSPSVELSALSLPPPPRRGFGVGLKNSNGVERDKSRVIPASKMLKMVNEQKDQDVSLDGKEQEEEEEKPVTPIKQEQEEPERKQYFDRPPSPTIPSFSTSSAINSFPSRRTSTSLSPTNRSPGSPNSVSSMSFVATESDTSTLTGLISRQPRLSKSPQRPGALGRVRQHLFGINDADETEYNSHPTRISQTQAALAHLGQLDSTEFPPPHQILHRKHNRHSSGNTATTTKPRSPVAVPAASTSALHRRSISLSPAGLFASGSRSTSTSPRTSKPFAASRLPLPTPPSSPLTPQLVLSTPETVHRSRSSSNIRSGFSSRNLFSSSGSSSPAALMHPAGPRPSSSSRQRTMTTFMGRSTGASSQNSTASAPSTPSQSGTPLTDQQKIDKWNDLLARSARAGGTLHLAVGSRLLDSDGI